LSQLLVSSSLDQIESSVSNTQKKILRGKTRIVANNVAFVYMMSAF
jgi:hypothetical protein